MGFVKGLDLRAEPFHRKLCWVPPGKTHTIALHYSWLKKTIMMKQVDAWPVSKLSYLGGWSESCENVWASSEAVRGWGKESLQRSLIKYHLYFTQTKGNTIGWKMTLEKTKLIDNRPSWHPLRLCDKFGSQGDQIGTKNVFQPSKQTRGLIWFSYRKENIASRG